MAKRARGTERWLHGMAGENRTTTSGTSYPPSNWASNGGRRRDRDRKVVKSVVSYTSAGRSLGVPEHDRFHVITEHTKASQPFDRDHLGIHRSDACIFFQITLNSGRSTELKQRFYKTLADRLHEGVKIRKEDVFIHLVEVPKENGSFGNGEAQYVTPPK
jgi:4-oxalocrotonate tautomerase